MRRTQFRDLFLSETLEIRRLLASAISGVVWRDANLDSQHTAAEAGAVGVKAFADYNNNGVPDAGETSAITGADGQFKLNAVRSGSYPVRVVLGSTLNQSMPFKNYGRWVSVKSTSVGAIQFGVYPRNNTGAVNGLVFNDRNGDKIQNSDEPGIGGRSVFVDYDNDKRMDASEPRGVSLADGRYQINGIVASPSNRAVRQILPDFWEQASPVAITYATSPRVGYAAWVAISSGKILTGVHLGSHRLWGQGVVVGRAMIDEDGDGIFDGVEDSYRSAAITGVGIWVDYDNDGKRDSDEPCPVYTDMEFPGWGISLPGIANVEEASYQIREVNAGHWPVRMSLMSGWKATTSSVSWVDVYPEKTVQAKDFLAQPGAGLGSITTSVFHDWNRDGKNNDWTPDRNNGVSGARLFIDLDRVNNDAGMPEFNDPVQNVRYYSEMGSDTTVGIFGLPSGTYRLRVSVPYFGEEVGWSMSTDTQDGIEVVVKSGQDTTVMPGFGLYRDG